MGVPGFGFIVDIMMNVLGFILLVGIAIGVVFVLVRRNQQRKSVEQTWTAHDYGDSAPPPPPGPPAPPASS